MIKINLGCGKDYKDPGNGWKNIDISKEVKADIYLDIRKEKLPFEDDSVDEIYCSGVLEQILLNEDFIFALNECHRVLKTNGTMTIVVPNSRNPITFQDPMDCRHFIPETFGYFDIRANHYKFFGKTYGFKGWIVEDIKTREKGTMTIIMSKP